MSLSKRLVPVLVVIAVAAASFWAASASASRTVTIGSKISIKPAGVGFAGRVTSSNGACAENRRVTLFKAVHGGSPEAIGHAKTDPSGHWKIAVSGFAGVSMTPFYAKAPRRSEGAAGTIYVCSAARSKTITLGS